MVRTDDNPSDLGVVNFFLKTPKQFLFTFLSHYLSALQKSLFSDRYLHVSIDNKDKFIGKLE